MIRDMKGILKKMSHNVVNIQNIQEIEFSALVELLRDVYNRDLPTVDINTPPDTVELEQLMVYFSNQYSYITELWAKMSHEVRLLKRTSKNKDAIDEAMGTRDYLEKIMSALKLKYYSVRTMLKIHSEEVR